MVTRIYTKEMMEQKQEEKSLEQEFKEVINERQQIVYDTWYKLFLLQNYDIDMSMFKGTCLRWSSILTYLTHIRAIYKGYKYKTPVTKALVEYITGLMDSGMEPYALPQGKKQKKVTIKELINNNILTKQQIDFIYSPVGVTKELPDTSVAWTQSISERQYDETHHENYTQIVETLPHEETSSFARSSTITNPINKNPFKFKLSHISKLPLHFALVK